MFCAVGLDNASFHSGIYTTVDGTTWTRATTPWDAITAGTTGVYQRPSDGLLVATRRYGGTGNAQLMSSSDFGATWTERHISQSSLENGYQAYRPVYDPNRGIWVCIGSDVNGYPAVFTGDLLVPGSGWTNRTPAGTASTGIASATDGVGTVVILVTSNRIQRFGTGSLPNPVAIISMGSSWQGQDIIWAGAPINLFVVAGHFTTGGSRIATSPDGVTWTAQTLPGDAADTTHNGWCGAVGWNGSMLVALGKVASGSNVTAIHAYTSTDGVTWTDRGTTGFGTSSTDQYGFAGHVGWDGTRWGALYNLNGTGSTGNTWSTSTDGVTWVNHSSPFVANNNLDATGIIVPAIVGPSGPNLPLRRRRRGR